MFDISTIIDIPLQWERNHPSPGSSVDFYNSWLFAENVQLGFLKLFGLETNDQLNDSECIRLGKKCCENCE